MDGDSDADLLLTVAYDESIGRVFDGDVRVYLNDGLGVFSELTQPVTLQKPGVVAELVDVDGDGDPDLLTRNGILENDGTGVFSDNGLGYPAQPAWVASYVEDYLYPVPPVVADLDGDGDTDLFGHHGASRGHRPSMNLTRHLSWYSFPRLGAPLRLDMTGPPSGLAFLFAASALLPAPMQTSLGLAHLEGASISLTRARLLDVNGEATFGVAMVPQDPSLAGVDVHWQSIVGPPYVLAAFETTTLTTF